MAKKKDKRKQGKNDKEEIEPKKAKTYGDPCVILG
jgi:hypothetical protein